MTSHTVASGARSAKPLPASISFGGARLLQLGVSTSLLYLIIPPVFVLLQTSFTVSDGFSPDTLSSENYRAIFQSSDLPALAWNSLSFAFGSAIVGIGLGSLTAWLVVRTNAPMKTLVYVSAFVALAVPYVISTIGWIFLLNSRNGLINVWLMGLFHLSSAPFDIFTMKGMILVDGLQSAPMAFLLTAVPLRSMDPALEEAAAMSGASQRQILWRITFRLGTPAFLAVLLLIFVRSVEAFETPALLGLPGRVHVLTTEIYQKIHGGAFPDYGLGSAYSVILIAVVSVGIYGYNRATREAQRFAVITGKGYSPRVYDLSRLRYPAGFAVLALPAVTVAPLAIMAWASFQKFYQLPSVASLRMMTFANYLSVLDRSDIKAALLNSIVTAGCAASMAVLLTTAVAWLMLRTKLPGSSALDHLVSISLALPGVVLGLAMLKTYLIIPLPIYGTIWILVVAHIVRSLPFAMRYAHVGIAQIHKDLEESGQMSGAAGFVVFRRILLPLLIPALFSGWIWVFLNSIRELPMTLILVGPSSQMLASVIFDLWSGGQLLDMAAFSVMVTTCFVVIAFLLWRISERWGIQP